RPMEKYYRSRSYTPSAGEESFHLEKDDGVGLTSIDMMPKKYGCRSSPPGGDASFMRRHGSFHRRKGRWWCRSRHELTRIGKRPAAAGHIPPGQKAARWAVDARRRLSLRHTRRIAVAH